MPNYGEWFINEHGVRCYMSHSGSMYGRVIDGQFRTAILRPVPECCINCCHLDEETDDMGYLIAGPICGLNLFLPTRAGKCKRQNK